MTTEQFAKRFEVGFGNDFDTGDDVASVVRDDGLHLNLELVDALLELGQRYPATFQAIAEMIYSLADPPDVMAKN